MSSLASRPSAQFVKGLIIGDPGSGKTGGLESLVRAGYDLRIYDFDNLLGSLQSEIEKRCPDRMDSVKVQTFTDKMEGKEIPIMMNGGAVKVLPMTRGMPTALTSALKQLNHWKTPDEDLGPPAKWGPNAVLVVDTLTTLSRAAFRYAQAMNPAAKEPQTYYFTAQQLIGNVLDLLCSKDMETNVLVLAHIDYSQNQMNLVKGFPRSIGSALNSQIAGYFNSVLLVESQGNKRLIRTNSTGIVDLKNPITHRLSQADLPLEDGLAAFFKAIQQRKD